MAGRMEAGMEVYYMQAGAGSFPYTDAGPVGVQQGCCLSVADLPYCPLARLAIASQVVGSARA